MLLSVVLVSIVVSIPACHAGDRGSIPRQGDVDFVQLMTSFGYHFTGRPKLMFCMPEALEV